MNSVFVWLSSIPPALLYVVAGGMSLVENVVPPLPSDVVIALAVFLTARNKGPFWIAAVATWVGSISGAMLMYAVGHRYGSRFVMKKLDGAGAGAAKRLLELHARYGAFALVLSRFLPGVRAIVPPVAGAMRMPVWQVGISMGIASAIWYGFVTYLAYQAGENWPALLDHVQQSTRLLGIVAGGIVAVVVLALLIRSAMRTRRSNKQ